jgi:hypothetical protein
VIRIGGLIRFRATDVEEWLDRKAAGELTTSRPKRERRGAAVVDAGPAINDERTRRIYAAAERRRLRVLNGGRNGDD